MTKLNGTSAQLFSVIARSIDVRVTAQSEQGSKGKSTAGSSFNDLLRTVTNLAKRALDEQASGGAAKAGALRTRLAHMTERDKPDSKAISERTELAEDPEPANRHDPLDHAPKIDVERRLSLATIAGQEIAAAPVVRPQAQPFAGERREAPARSERPSAGREVQGAGVAKAATTDVAGAGAPRPAAVPQAAMAQQENASATRSASAAPSFEIVTANIARAAKVSGREVLPEASKVTVIQQETHLPPVPQFTATQQVANAVVAELKGSSTRAPSTLSDPAAPQTNTPDQPLRILTISLEPPALGNVTVRLRLVGAAVSVHLAADRRDTSQMLEMQRDSIRELMQSAGYVADVAPVQHGALDGFQSGSGQSQSSFSGQQQTPNGQGGLGNSGASSGEPQGRAKQAPDERQPNQETRHEQEVAPHTRRGPVYL